MVTLVRGVIVATGLLMKVEVAGVNMTFRYRNRKRVEKTILVMGLYCSEYVFEANESFISVAKGQ